MITQDMIDAQNKRLHDGLEDVSKGIIQLQRAKREADALIEQLSSALSTYDLNASAGVTPSGECREIGKRALRAYAAYLALNS